MGRWEPGARERLERAALELYAERGFEQTTVAGIAGHAGLTERTFFRHFADKREVLFSGQDALVEGWVDAIAAAPPSAAPIDAVAEGLAAVCAAFEGRRTFARRRQSVIAANGGLRERELLKLAALSSETAGALRGRGVAEPVASLAAEAGVAVFKVAFERWISDGDDANGGGGGDDGDGVGESDGDGDGEGDGGADGGAEGWTFAEYARDSFDHLKAAAAGRDLSAGSVRR